MNKKIESLSSKLTDNDSISSILKDGNFISLYKSKKSIKTKILCNIKTVEFNKKNLNITILTMQSLNDSDYLIFLDLLIKEMIKNRFSHDEISIAIAPPPPFDSLAIKRHTSKKHIDFYEQIDPKSVPKTFHLFLTSGRCITYDKLVCNAKKQA